MWRETEEREVEIQKGEKKEETQNDKEKLRSQNKVKGAKGQKIGREISRGSGDEAKTSNMNQKIQWVFKQKEM